MTTQNDGGPAFPQSHSPNFPNEIVGGLTLRDYFAAHAPEPPKAWHGGEKDKTDIIEWRWSYADSMLSERNK